MLESGSDLNETKNLFWSLETDGPLSLNIVMNQTT